MFEEGWFDVDRSETPDGSTPREPSQVT
jgi:hypothetical protein